MGPYFNQIMYKLNQHQESYTPTNIVIAMKKKTFNTIFTAFEFRKFVCRQQDHPLLPSAQHRSKTTTSIQSQSKAIFNFVIVI